MESLEQHNSFQSSDNSRRASFSVSNLKSSFRIPGVRTMESLASGMSSGQKMLLVLFSIILVIASIGLLNQLTRSAMSASPARGGSFSEGLLGTPRFINPLLANSDADRDLTILTYSGLMRALPDGSLVPDLAENYSVSEDGIEYTFTLKENAVFHDGESVTSADVVFTIETAQNPDIKSTKRANWEGVRVEALDEKTVLFTLAQPYAPFLENATIGILPEHLWRNVASDSFAFHQLNTRPIGSGPYKINRIKTDSSGTPIEYQLSSFSRFTFGAPFIENIFLRFYGDEDAQIAAYNSGDVDAIAGITASRAPEVATRGTLTTTALPRIFAVFFNQNQAPLFLDDYVREALDKALDKEALINSALSGYGTALSGPIPPKVLSSGVDSSVVADPEKTHESSLQKARETLEDGGWTINEETGVYEDKDSTPLAFSISTADTPELTATAEAVADVWRELGVDVSVKVFSAGSINMNVIRPRNYDALLFGEVVGRTLDLFAFWHSSQRNDPGLNLALYTNAKADTLLSEARGEIDQRAREEAYASFAAVVEEDAPAVFLYAPDFLYYLPNKLEDVSLGVLTNASDRFLNAHQWHIETKYVWHIFSN